MRGSFVISLAFAVVIRGPDFRAGSGVCEPKCTKFDEMKYGIGRSSV